MHRTRIPAVARLSCAMRCLLLIALTGCGWASARHITFGYQSHTDSAGVRTAIVAHYLSQQAPTGVRAFPDGGKPRVLFAGVLVYWCDHTARTWRLLGAVSEPAADVNLPVIVRDWDRTGFTVGVGLRMPGPVYSLTRVDLDGTMTRIGRGGASPQRGTPGSEYCRLVRDSLERDSATRSNSGGMATPPGVQ